MPKQWRFPDGSVDITIIRSLLPTPNGFGRVTPSPYTTCEALIDAVLSVQDQQYLRSIIYRWRRSISLPVYLSFQLHTASTDTPMFFTAQLMLDALQSSLYYHRLCVLFSIWSSRWRLAKASTFLDMMRVFLPHHEPLGYDMDLACITYWDEKVTAAWTTMRHNYLRALIPQSSQDFVVIKALCIYSQYAFVTSTRMVTIYTILTRLRLQLFMNDWLSAYSTCVDRFTDCDMHKALRVIPILPPLHTAGGDILRFLSAQLLADNVQSTRDSAVLCQSILSWQMHCYKSSLSCDSPWDIYLLYQMTSCITVM